MIKVIDHVNISVSNISVSKDFYCDYLGFILVKQGELTGEWIDKVVGLKGVKAKYAMLSLPGCTTNIELIEYLSPKGESLDASSKSNTIGVRHIAFEVDNINQIYKKLVANKVEFISDIQIYNNKKKLCYFYDPDGVILELAKYS